MTRGLRCARACRLLLLASFWSLATLMSAVAAPTRWAERWYNPKPAAGDLTLPLPCGGAIVFRLVPVPAGTGVLADRAITLGSANATLGYNQYQRHAFLAAPFRGARGDDVYYLGKYPVTRDQYAAVMGHCPSAPSPRGRLPVADVSWFAAVQFTARLSGWLLQRDRAALPEHAGVPGFVRLPTEAEWEYAARGGVAVSPTQYQARLWPMPDGSRRYLPHEEDGPSQIGFGLPNPLGLYDLLGNVWQWTLTPYRLNRVGRAQGQPGGLVARGGGYATATEALSTALREEVPPFDVATGKPTQLPFIGFRVAIGAVAGGSLAHVKRLEAGFAALMRAGSEKSGSPAPSAVATSLASSTSDKALKIRLSRLAAQLASDQRARVDAADATLHAQLAAASALAYVVWRLERIIGVQRAVMSSPDYQTPANAPALAEVKRGIAGNRADQDSALGAYAALLRSAAFGPAHDDIGKETALVDREFAASGDRRRRFLDVISGEAGLLAQGHVITPEQMLREITTIPGARNNP